jgi:hypothetical protein
MSSSDGNYSCMVCGGGRERCCATHCETCGDHAEFTCECEALDHRECSGGQEGCSYSDVRFRLRDQQPLLDRLAENGDGQESSDSDEDLEAVTRFATDLRTWAQENGSTAFAGLYDGEDAIVPSVTSFERPVEFLIGDRYDNDPEGWEATACADGRSNTTFYILVDVWCASCYPRTDTSNSSSSSSSHDARNAVC